MFNNTKFEINTVGRDFFVGDLHGCFDKLMTELDNVDFDTNKDRLFCVGDLADRGPDSVKCISLLKAPWFHCCLGNHEDLLLGSHSYYVWMSNGGQWCDDVSDETLADLRDLVRDKCHLTMTVKTPHGNIGVVHAESVDNWYSNMGPDTRETNLWSRRKIRNNYNTPIENIDKVIVGHTVVNEVVQLANILYIDTGAVFNRKLTLLSVEDVFFGNYTKIE